MIVAAHSQESTIHHGMYDRQRSADIKTRRRSAYHCHRAVVALYTVRIACPNDGSR